MPVKVYDGTNWVTVAGDGATGAPGSPGTSSSISTWVKTAAGGETSVSGTGDTGYGTLAYTVGQELVYLNGVLLDRGDDYTATNGTSITGLTALTANDIITVWTVNSFSVANTYTIAQADAAFVAATNAGGITLLSTSTLNNGTSAQNITGITGSSYKQILVTVDNMNTSGGQNWHFRLNSDTGSNYVRGYQGQYWAGGDAAVSGPDTQVYLGNRVSNQTGTWWKKGYGVFMIYNCSSSGQMIVDWKAISQDGGAGATFTFTTGIAIYNASAALTSFGFTLMDSTFTAGTVKVYGVK
jgi:hypothetical protein